MVGPAPEMTDQDLVERARRGHVGAYDELVQRYTEMAFRTAYQVTGSAADAEEAVQDAFVKAHGALHRFHAGAPFRPWLLRIVGNEARNRRRATGRRAALELRAARLQTGAAAADPEDVAGFRALVPAALGQPDEVWYRPSPGVLTLLYHPRPGLPPSDDRQVGALVMEASGSVGQTSFVKLVGPNARVQPVTVDGSQGFWISGAPHAFFFYGRRSDQTDSFRLAGDVVIWNQSGLVIRIESGLDEQAALRVAGTTR